MSIDIAHFQEELEQARDRLNRTIEHHDIGTASLEEDAREQLHQVEKALARIESGEYGRCEVCGKEIPVERLEAVPWTTLCIDDARRLAR